MIINSAMKIAKPFLQILIVCIVSLVNPTEVFVQQPGHINWSNETILWEDPDRTSQMQLYFPNVLADNYGNVHVFWVDGHFIYYLQKGSSGWMSPTDIVYSATEISFHSEVIDQDGNIYLVWTTPGTIYLKHAPAYRAEYVHAWSQEKVIGLVGNIGTPLRIAVDNQNALHILFADWQGKDGKTVGGNVYHFSSVNSGELWSNYRQISNVPPGDLATDPRMICDDQGRVHIVWGQLIANQEGAPDRGVYYARLDDYGNGPLLYKVIAETQPDITESTAINIGVVDKDDIVTMWTCGYKAAKRCYSLSLNGGGDWTPYKHIFGDLLGLSGWDSMFVDGSGDLYWMGVLRYPQGMYYSHWDGTRWSDPPYTASQDRYIKLGENIMTAVGLGNEVHAVAQALFGDKIIYISGVTSAEHTSAFTEPDTTGSETPTVRSEITQTTGVPLTTTPSHITNGEFTSANPSNVLNSNIRIFSLSILAVVVTLAMVISITRFKKK
jgi:hypothetical protein